MIRTLEKPDSRLASVAHNEWWAVAGVTLLVLVVTSLPYLYGSQSAPPDRQFMGIMLDVPDHLQYFSWMRELSSSNLAANKLTPEANQAVFFNLLWWMLGRLDSTLGIGYAGALQVLRVVSTLLFLPLVYKIGALFLNRRRDRLTAFLLIVFGAGLGWVLILMKYSVTPGVVLFPLDVFVAEGNTFLSILGYPHFIGAALYCGVFLLFLKGQVSGRLIWAVLAGMLALFLGWQHAYDLISVYSVIGAYGVLLLVRDRRLPPYVIKAGLVIGAISVWPALYSVLLTSLDPLWKEVLAQFANAGVFTPGPLHLPILYGIPFVLAVVEIIREKFWRLHKASDLDLFLWGWFLITFVTIYLPVDYQIHLLNGWQIPMGILAARALANPVIPWLSERIGRLFPQLSLARVANLSLGMILIFASFTNIYHLGQRFLDLSRHDYPYYLYKDDLAALNWLEQNVQPSDVVISSLTLGQYIPAETGAHAFLAHWAQTVRFYEKEDLVLQVFSVDTSPAARLAIFDRFGVDYLFWGPAERSLGNYYPDEDPALSEVYTSPQVKVFRVRP